MTQRALRKARNSPATFVAPSQAEPDIPVHDTFPVLRRGAFAPQLLCAAQPVVNGRFVIAYIDQ